MKAILISIKPQYAAAIYAGTKTYELRKCHPNIFVGTPMLIYETSPVKRVTGMAYYNGTFEDTPLNIWCRLYRWLGITKGAYMEYYKNDSIAYAWQLLKVKQFTKPMELSDFSISRPPQSYQFIDLSDDFLGYFIAYLMTT